MSARKAVVHCACMPVLVIAGHIKRPVHCPVWQNATPAAARNVFYACATGTLIVRATTRAQQARNQGKPNHRPTVPT